MPRAPWARIPFMMMMKIPSAKLSLLLALLLSATAGGCYSVQLGAGGVPEDAIVGTNQFTLMVGESMTLNMVGVSRGMETQGWDCDDEDDDTMVVSDSSVMKVEKQSWTKPVNVNGTSVNAPVFMFTALKVGEVTITAKCVDDEESVYVKVTKKPAPHLAPTNDAFRVK